MSESGSGWDAIEELTKKLRLISDKVAILVVTNLKSSPGYDQHSLETEYLAEDELDQILSALRAYGLYVEPFLSEDDFIKAVLEGYIEGLDKSYKIVYNSAQTGKGPGRKALVPAFCQLHGIPTTSSDPYVVSLARQKFHFTLILQALGLPVPPSWSFSWKDGWLLKKRPPLGTKVILKPTYESASIGIDANSVMVIEEGVESLIENLSRRHSQPITVQTFVSGFEVEVPVIGCAKPFVPMAVGISVENKRLLGDEFLTYDRVFGDDYKFYTFEQFGSEHLDYLKTVAAQAYSALGVAGLGRIDFRVDSNGNCYIMDVSTNPHVIKHSSFAHIFSCCGRSYEDLLATLVALSCHREEWL